MNRLFAAILLLTLALPTPTWSRNSGAMPYDRLAERAEVIAIIEAMWNRPADDLFPGENPGPSPRYQAINTGFKVRAFLKGGEAPKELTLLHFDYASDPAIIVNGAQFIEFPLGPREYEKPAPKNQPNAKPTLAYADAPVWLAFLKRRSDGRYEPVNDQYDSRHSFRELCQVPFSMFGKSK